MLKELFGKTVGGISAGILVSIGGTVFLCCENKVVGAVFFSVALLSICYLNCSLFTGKVGFLPYKHGKEEISVLLLGLLGNLIGAYVFGISMKYCLGGLEQNAYLSCVNKLESNNFLTALIKGAACGALMFVAVFVFKEHGKNPLGILFCIPTFILCGFEHSIADMFYFAASGIYSLEATGFIMTVVLGNAIGAILLALMKIVADKIFLKEDKNQSEKETINE